MKLNPIQRIAIAAGFALSTAAMAQSPAPPDASTQAAQAREATLPAPAASPAIPVEPPSLIPPNTLPGPEAGSLPQMPGAPELEKLNALFKKTSLGKAADEYRLRVQMAELETRIRNDDDLHALKASAFAAPTDLERRHRLKTYYQRYFTKLRARATNPDLRAYLDAQEADRELLLLQPKVRHESDEAEATRLAAIKSNNPDDLKAPKPTQARVNDVFNP